MLFPCGCLDCQLAAGALLMGIWRALNYKIESISEALTENKSQKKWRFTTNISKPPTHPSLTSVKLWKKMDEEDVKKTPSVIIARKQINKFVGLLPVV